MSDEVPLSEEWGEVAITAARNSGLDADPSKLSPEHWQRVSAAVGVRMRMCSVEATAGWREDLAAMVDRNGDGLDGPES